MVSHLFWPRFKKQSFKLPGQLGRLAKQYQKAFTKLKPEKRLEWLPALGSISLEIVLEDRKLELEVTPLQAAVLELFDARGQSWVQTSNMIAGQLMQLFTATHTLQDLRQTLRVRDVNQVKSALQFWQSKGVVAQVQSASSAISSEYSEATWTLLETNPNQAGTEDEAVQSMHIQEEATAAGPSVSTEVRPAVDPQEAFEAIQPFWGFVQNALANLHSLPSTRLQKMMTSLAPGYSGRTLEELECFLEVARSEGLLVKGKDGFWRLAAL